MSQTILVVDDEPLNRMLLRTILEHDGYTVLEAADGAAALEVARAKTPSLIIMDLHMPRIDGPELLKRLRADPALLETRVALYTATAAGRAMRDFMEANNVFFTIPKPSDPKTVLEIVHQALGRE